MMRAISLWQPWASAIALGHKQIETRNRLTRVRSFVAIHAAKRWTAEQAEFASVERALGRMPEQVPLGAIVAVARIVDCQPVEALCPDPVEKLYGNYEPGRFGWILDEVQPLATPVGCAGSQGFFYLDPCVERAVREQLLGAKS